MGNDGGVTVVRTYGRGGSGPLILFMGHPFLWVHSRFHSCMVIFAHVQPSSFVHSLHPLSSHGGGFWLVVHLIVCGGHCCPWALIVHGWGLVVIHRWRVVHGGVIVICGGVSSFVGWALPSVGGALV